MIDILRNFIRAQRSGNWELHLQSLSDMLPYLAASGHNHYTKCVWIYLQQMSKLEDEHPTVYRVFKYELCSYPPALFESPLLLCEAQKPALADAIWSLLQAPNLPAVCGQVQYVLDGGAVGD